MHIAEKQLILKNLSPLWIVIVHIALSYGPKLFGGGDGAFYYLRKEIV